ncbi:HIT family protein [Rhizobium sp. PL01]|uniref:HIT family protein n=1 Tax=Rhizobium sp. PL01 TaxID=3085631 RepID=UPI00298197A8|nr:HIT family protein [Rhizobium sp. PL01]MDW5313848.1 HIT family protein [Rhizobium sp. PL01]
MTNAAYDTNNIFAKILRGEIPAHKVYEDDNVLAFMDVMPQAEGHVLVVPKAASRNILDADPATLGALIAAVQKVAIAAEDAFEADGVTIMQFNEAPAGQSVFHLHFHVIPRKEGMPLRPHSGKMEDGAVLAANAERIRDSL